MQGVLFNTLTVIVGSLIGLIFKKGIPQKLTDCAMAGIGLCTLYIGISGALKGSETLVLIISMVLGAMIGALLDIDGRLNSLVDTVVSKTKKNGSSSSSTITEGFITACLLFCVGAMTIVGSINAGLKGDNTMLYTKAVLDFFSSMILSVSLGVGVIFAALFVLVFQGGLVLLAGVLEPLIASEAMINEITCAGSVIIMGLGLNILNITKLKIANYLPALSLAPLVFAVMK